MEKEFSLKQYFAFVAFSITLIILFPEIPKQPNSWDKSIPLTNQLLVRVKGFAPPAPTSRRQYSTRLSYTPSTIDFIALYQSTVQGKAENYATFSREYRELFLTDV